MQCVDLGGRRIIKKNFFQAEDGIRDPEMSRGLGDVYKRQVYFMLTSNLTSWEKNDNFYFTAPQIAVSYTHLTLPTICSV